MKLLFLLRDVSFIVEHPSRFVSGEYFDMIRQLIGLSLAVACVAISGCEKDASTAVVASSLTQSPEPAVEAMTISPRSTELFV